MRLVPDELRQDRVFAVSPGLFLVSVSTLPRHTSVSVTCRDEAKRERKNVVLAGGKGEATLPLCPQHLVKAVEFGCQEGHNASFEQPVERQLRKALCRMHTALLSL